MKTRDPGDTTAGLASIDGTQEAPAAAPMQRYLLLLVLLAVACAAATAAAQVFLPQAADAARVLVGAMLFLVLAAPIVWYQLLAPLLAGHARRLGEQTTKANLAEDRLRAHETDARLQHALEIAEDEPAVLRIAEQALRAVAGAGGAQLLLADDPDGDVSHTITVGDMEPAARCVIRRPADCPSIRRGQGLVYEDGMALSACPGLSGQIDTGCAAACTPIFTGGRGTGMVRALGTADDPALYRLLQSLNFNAHKVGTRLAGIRSVAASEAKATTDPLTGLHNRRALDARLAILLDQQAPFALVIADIDHFKKINDNHGHEVGDRALKVLASALRQTVRRHDLVCRFGGEEFVILLVGLDAGAAAELLERLRAELPRATTRGGVPAFTISAGVVDQQDGPDGEALLRIADGLLYEAKSQGRDRVRVSPRSATAALPAGS
ncbi:MAG: GGDEF domain-containing protein [Dokdonella sp.]|uniref:GGDEF domain-containing protein n=1 Tax=Dokdonella sp. TaxID=2291710 RepID=UPI0025BC01C9|nr:GGDEF domain-containing protein [Dokdonella sp.]MBX3700504.1 GGDEF domain-containing protein [Dokdonella sp.]